jgi:hypothetical protein
MMFKKTYFITILITFIAGGVAVAGVYVIKNYPSQKEVLKEALTETRTQRRAVEQQVSPEISTESTNREKIENSVTKEAINTKRAELHRISQEAKEKVYRNDRFDYTVSYPNYWFPYRHQYANEFEIRNNDSKDPQFTARNRALVRIVDTVNESAEVTDKFLDSLLVEENTPEQEHQALTIDGHRAVRVRRKLARPTGSSTDKPAFYLAIATYIANGKHMISIQASIPIDADASLIEEIIKIEESVKFDKLKNE